MQVTSLEITPGYANAKNKKDLRHYFEYSAQGVDVVEDGLKEISFGEYLVDQGVLDRFQLFRALQMQDRLPGVRLGEARGRARLRADRRDRAPVQALPAAPDVTVGEG